MRCPATTFALAAVAVSLATGCTNVSSVSKDELVDAAVTIEIPVSPEGLCDFPDIPPRLPAVSIDEEACSKSSESWPDCLADQCDASGFEAACRQYCQMSCERERWFCTASRCLLSDEGEDGYCDSEEALQDCMDLCDDDADCLNMACEEKREARCNELECPSGENNDCGGLTCNNECDTAFDSECDDGSPINSPFEDPVCELGNDCADCGARAACFALGDECFATSQCCGFEDRDAWCVNVGTDDAPLGRCVPAVPACGSGGNGMCPDGFECNDLVDGDDDAACFPACAFANSGG